MIDTGKHSADILKLTTTLDNLIYYQHYLFKYYYLAQTSGAVEYIDFIYTDGVRPTPMRVLDMKLNNLMVRLK